MKRFLDKTAIERLIKDEFNSVSDFCRYIDISRSHFDGMIKGKISAGKRTLKKLCKLTNNHIFDIEEILEPLPILINDKEYIEILVTDKDDNLIASITSQNEITHKNYKVEYISKN